MRALLGSGSTIWFRGIDCGFLSASPPRLLRDGKAMDVVYERERRLLTRFRQRSIAYWSAGYPQNEWEHMFAIATFWSAYSSY